MSRVVAGSAVTDAEFTRDISLGTTIIAVTFDGGVVLGADSRTSSGSYIANRVQDKITPLVENKIYLCRSGSASDTQAIASYVQFYLSQHQAERGGPVRVETAATLAKQLAYDNKNMLQAGLIIAGHDASGGSVWAIPLGGTLLRVPYAIGGSGSAYITGWCDKNWRGGMSKEEALQFVRTALKHAMARDSSSGGCVRTVVIDDVGATRDFIPGSKLPPTFGEMAAP